MGALALAAVAGGLLTLLAPCSVMLLPAFFAYAFTSPRALLSRTLVFWLGLLTTLLPLGVLAGSLGALLRTHMETVTLVGGLAVVVLGLMQALAVPLPLPHPGGSSRRDAASPLSVYLLGALAGLAGVGCAGPILGAVLVMAGLGGSPLQAALLMALYALGMVLPLGLLALLWDALDLSSRSWLRPRPVRLLGRSTTWTELIGGSLCVALGVLMIVRGPQGLSAGLLSSAALLEAERRIMAGAGAVPWWLVLALVGVLVAAVVVSLRGRRR